MPAVEKESPPTKPFFWLDKKHLQEVERRDADLKRKSARAGLVVGLIMLAVAGCGIVYLYNTENTGVPDYSGASDRWNGLCGMLLIAGLIVTAISAFALRVYRVVPASIGLAKRLSKDDWFKIALIVSILSAAVIIAVALHWKTAP